MTTLSSLHPSEGTVICGGRPASPLMPCSLTGDSVSTHALQSDHSSGSAEEDQRLHSCLTVRPQQWSTEGDSVSLLLKVEHAAQSRIAIWPLYWSVEGDNTTVTSSAKFRSTSAVHGLLLIVYSSCSSEKEILGLLLQLKCCNVSCAHDQVVQHGWTTLYNAA